MDKFPGMLGLSSRRHDDTTTVVVTGEVDIATTAQLQAYAEKALGHAPARVVLEMSGVSFFAAAGLNVLAALERLAAECGVELFLGEVSPAVNRMLHITGLQQRYPSAVPAMHPELPEPR
jgi:anti-anti-sigma factor